MKRATITNALICAVVSMSIISCDNSKVYDVRLSGEGVDLFPDSSRVLVFHKGADIRFDDPVASARLDGGTFNMSFQDSVVRQYELMFEEDMMDGQFQFFNFFSDRVPLHFTFGSKFGELTVDVNGSRDNEELYLYRNKSRRKARRITWLSRPCLTEQGLCGTVSMLNPTMMSGRWTD